MMKTLEIKKYMEEKEERSRGFAPKAPHGNTVGYERPKQSEEKPEQKKSTYDGSEKRDWGTWSCDGNCSFFY